MKEIQEQVEFTYSKRSISNIVRAEVDEESTTIQMMNDAINKYKSGEYSYQSKRDRVSKLNEMPMTSMDIAIEIAVLVLPIKVVSPIQAVCSVLGSQLEYHNRLDGIKTAAELLAVCEEAGLYDIYHSTESDNETGTLGICPNYEVSQEVSDFINQTKYLPPMLCKPKKWNSFNQGGGNLLNKDCMILGAMNKTSINQRVDVINTLQEIPWELNLDMLEFVETSKKALDTHEKKANFNFMKKTSEQVYCELLDQGNKFFFVWKRDSRGRSYSQGYHVNLQANSYKKAILNFHHKELLTDEVY